MGNGLLSLPVNKQWQFKYVEIIYFKYGRL